jgi:hypothetical protein
MSYFRIFICTLQDYFNQFIVCLHGDINKVLFFVENTTKLYLAKLLIIKPGSSVFLLLHSVDKNWGGGAYRLKPLPNK